MKRRICEVDPIGEVAAMVGLSRLQVLTGVRNRLLQKYGIEELKYLHPDAVKALANLDRMIGVEELKEWPKKKR